MASRVAGTELEQRARALETEIERSRQLEAQLRAKVEMLDQAALRSATLQTITAELSKASTIEEVANVVIGVAHDALGAAASVAYFCRDDGPARLTAARGLDPSALEHLRVLPLDAPLPLAAALRTREPQWFDAREELLAAFPNLVQATTPSAALQAVAALPLLRGDGIIGGIAFSFSGYRAFDAAEREFLLTLAAQCVPALDRARMFEAERAALTETALLLRLTDAASRAGALEEIYEAALDAITAALAVPRASVLLFDTDGVMRFKAWRGLSDRYRAAVEGHSPWKPGEKNPGPILVEDVHRDPSLSGYLPLFREEGLGALGFFPLFSNELLLGKLMVYYAGPHRFTETEKRLAQAISHQVSFAVERQFVHQERDRILGIVSHDLRNPLGAIAMSAAMLLRQELDPRITRSVRRIANGAERMERLISQLLDFAQARHGGGIPIQRRPIELAEVVKRVADELETAYPDSAIALEIEGDTAGNWDPDRVAEVLSNLIGNAIQYGDGGAVGVQLNGVEDEARVAITNGGPPIPAGLMPTLFDPYRRGATSDPGRSQSVGLGLYISREIARAHGGQIEVRSDAAHGTTFTLRLPRMEIR